MVTNFFDGLFELVAPTRCVGCDIPGELLCDKCAAEILMIDAEGACPRCGAPYGWLICTECWESVWSFTSARCVGELEAPLSRAVTLYKDGGERRLAGLLAQFASDATPDWADWADALTFVPATAAAKRRRGFDHAQCIASHLGRLWGVPCVEALERRRARDQRSLGRVGRFENAACTFTPRRAVHGRVVLLDDVFTTGATLESAAATLLDAGAREVRALAVARAW